MEENGEGGEGHESRERWLVSYADFITLLFALFVLLYALSMQTPDHADRALLAVAGAIGARPQTGGIRPYMVQAAHGSPELEVMLKRDQLNQVRRNIASVLRQFPNSGVSLKIDERGLVMFLPAAKFFASGEAEITPSQMPVLEAVAASIQKLPNRMEIDGFTDSIPIANERFHDNWELSAARSASVLRYLLAHSMIDPDHLAIAGYGPYQPIGDNTLAEGRALNRRVEIIVKPLEDDWRRGGKALAAGGD